MPYDADTLYTLLPQYLRLRDAQQGEPLRALVAVLAGQAELLEENIAQLYDDLFIETASEWAIPYIGDLLGITPLASTGNALSARAEVANTIALRRRKGTPGALGQLAAELTGWETRVVEFFDRLAATQHLAAPRIDRPGTASIRGPRAESASFDLLPRNVDVRRISSDGLPRPNLTNAGIFVWRLGAHSVTRSIACPVAGDSALFRFHPAGVDTPLHNLPFSNDSQQQPVEARQLPMRITRLALDGDLYKNTPELYGRALRIELVDADAKGRPIAGAKPVLVSAKDVQVANLSDARTSTTIFGTAVTGTGIASTGTGTAGTGTGTASTGTGTASTGTGTTTTSTAAAKWIGSTAPGKFAIDPELGRLRAGSIPAGKALLLTFHQAFGAELGGGEYARAEQTGEALLQIKASDDAVAVLGSFAGAGLIEFTEPARHAGPLKVKAAANTNITLQAAPFVQPVLAPLKELLIEAAAGSEIVLRGLLISGPVRITGPAVLVRLEHCTLVPAKGAPSLVVESPNAKVEIVFCIAGAMRIPNTAQVRINDSILDAGDPALKVFAALDGKSAGASLQAEASTLIGRINTSLLLPAVHSIFYAIGDSKESSMQITRRQGSNAQHCWLPLDAPVVARTNCFPSTAHPEAIAFTSLRFGQPGYAQLSDRCPAAILSGSGTNAEPGAFHHLFNAQRETNLLARLNEYLPFGLQAGIIHAS